MCCDERKRYFAASCVLMTDHQQSQSNCRHLLVCNWNPLSIFDTKISLLRLSFAWKRSASRNGKRSFEYCFCWNMAWADASYIQSKCCFVCALLTFLNGHSTMNHASHRERLICDCCTIPPVSHTFKPCTHVQRFTTTLALDDEKLHLKDRSDLTECHACIHTIHRIDVWSLLVCLLRLDSLVLRVSRAGNIVHL